MNESWAGSVMPLHPAMKKATHRQRTVHAILSDHCVCW